MSKSKQIGTGAETAVVMTCKRRGWWASDRITLSGSDDRGDVDLAKGLQHWMFEVKAGKAAEKASRQQIEWWCVDAEIEAENGGYAFTALVTKRPGYGHKRADQWYLHIRLGTLLEVFDGKAFPSEDYSPFVTLLFGDFLDLLDAHAFDEIRSDPNPLDTQAKIQTYFGLA